MVLAPVADGRFYPDRPFLAVSAAIIRDGRILIVRRAHPPSPGVYTLPGGVVEAGETLHEAAAREVREETGLEVEPLALIGQREVIVRDDDGRVRRHFVILAYVARWIGGEPVLNDELTEAHWLEPQALAGLETTDGLAEIVAAAFAHVDAHVARGA